MGSTDGKASLSAILATAVSITALIGFGFVVYDRTRPSGPPQFKQSISSSEKAAELGDFLRSHDGEIVDLAIDCYTVAESHCVEPPFDVAKPFREQFNYEPLYLFEQGKCQQSPNDDCPGGWWIFAKAKNSGSVYDRAGAGTLRIAGTWRVKVGGLSAIVGANCIELVGADPPASSA